MVARRDISASMNIEQLKRQYDFFKSEEGITKIENGGTGAVTAEDAIKNLGIGDYIVSCEKVFHKGNENYTTGESLWAVIKLNSGIMIQLSLSNVSILMDYNASGNKFLGYYDLMLPCASVIANHIFVTVCENSGQSFYSTTTKYDNKQQVYMCFERPVEASGLRTQHLVMAVGMWK